MLQAEYVRSLNCNYERILLDKKPEEKRYQYCIMNRGGIKGLLSCGLRYINGLAYLYYDISSKQNVAQLFSGRCITREWIRDFLWSQRQIQQELERFLLDISNILWYPEQVFQDLESNVFSFLYVPYYEGETGFGRMMDFWVEHIDYEDEGLVECVYYMYEQFERNGETYLQTRIFEDARRLEKERVQEKILAEPIPYPAEESDLNPGETEAPLPEEKAEKQEKKGFLSIFEGKRHKDKKIREEYRQSMQWAMTGNAVAEETFYESADSYGQTVYVEEKAEMVKRIHRLTTPEGKRLCDLDRPMLSIGKKKGEVDLALEDASVSRIHARITEEKGIFYLEDLNSTNGTFKNGLRLQPYEKRRLDEGDEIKCSKTVLIFQ